MSKFLSLTTLIALLSLCFHPLLTAREITYPAGYDIVIDVTAAPYFADPTGVSDCGPAIQQAVLDAVELGGPAGSNAAPIVYFPNGNYKITTPVVLETETPGGPWRMMQGQSRDGVVLFLPDNTPGFQNANSPVPLISYFEGEWTNNAFTTLFENFTVEIGAGNPGAIGVRFHGNNVAKMHDVKIISKDPAGVGAIGLDLKAGVSAPGIIKNVEVDGFAIGIDIANPTTGAQGWTLKGISTTNQTEVAIQSHRKSIQIMDWVSVNDVPAYKSLFKDGMVTIINADLSTPNQTPTDVNAITGKGDFFYLENVNHSGYLNLIDDNGQIVQDLAVGEVYQGGPVYKLWEDSKDQRIGLPNADVPEIPWESPDLWEIVDSDAQGDDTEALQKALLSGAKTVYLLPGNFTISQSLRVGPNVQRIASNWARFSWNRPLADSGGAIFYWEKSNHNQVTIERLAADWLRYSEYMLHNASNADMILMDVFWAGGGIYRNEPTGGKLYIENTHNVPGGQVFRGDLPSWIITNQDTWAYQYNPEMAWPLLTVDGGTFRAFGFKYGEQQGPVVIAKNQSKVEILGGYMNVTHGDPFEPEDTPMIEVYDSQVSVRLIERAREHSGPPKWDYRHEILAHEERNGEVRTLLSSASNIIHRETMVNFPKFSFDEGGAMIPLYSSTYAEGIELSNTAPEVSIFASSIATVRGGANLFAEVSDTDGPALNPAIHWVNTSGPGGAYFSSPSSLSTQVSVSVPGTYTFIAVASDGVAETESAEVSVEFGSQSRVDYFADNMVRITDSSNPLDGIGDSSLKSLLQLAGDFYISSTNREQEIRLHFETSIREFSNASEELESATLTLFPKALVNPPVLELYLTNTENYGTASVRDFSAQGDIIATIDPQNVEVGKSISFDILNPLKSALENNEEYLGLQLRVKDGANGNGASNYIEFYSSGATRTPTSPYLEIVTANTVLKNLGSFIAWGNGSEGALHPFGTISKESDTAPYETPLKFSFYPSLASDLSAFYVYVADLGWCYIRAEIYPYVYLVDNNEWIYFATDGMVSFYYIFNDNNWKSL